MTVLLHHRTRRLSAILLLALTAATLGLIGNRHSDAQSQATFTYVVYPAGLNLISSAGDTAMTNLSESGTISGPLSSLRPDGTQELTDPAHMKPGYGYWANFTKETTVTYHNSEDSITLTIPAGQCAQIGNPSTKGSARVRGAERVFQFSAVSNRYIPTTLIGVGKGALACNDSRTSAVSVTYEGDTFAGVTWPDCCATGQVSNRGQALIRVQNASSAPMTVAIHQMDSSGSYLTGGVSVDTVANGCSSCQVSCDSVAAQSFSLAPGYYTLHVQFDGSETPDIQLDAQFSADQQYLLCYHPSDTPVAVTSPPAATPSLTATALDSHTVRLDWAYPSSDETGFKIFDNHNHNLIATVDGSTTSYTVPDLPSFQTYCFVVYAYNDGGFSPPSPETCAATPE